MTPSLLLDAVDNYALAFGVRDAEHGVVVAAAGHIDKRPIDDAFTPRQRLAARHYGRHDDRLVEEGTGWCAR